MRSIGLPEMLVLFGMLLLLAQVPQLKARGNFFRAF